MDINLGTQQVTQNGGRQIDAELLFIDDGLGENPSDILVVESAALIHEIRVEPVRSRGSGRHEVSRS